MRTKYKPWALPYILEHSEVMLSMDDIASFTNDAYLEIGSGKGGFLVNMALSFKDKQFIGIERNVTCSGFTAKKLVEQEVNNAKLIYGDAGLATLKMHDKTVNTIFLNFSDPWPKKRHHKRRLTAPSFLKEYARILKDDGKLIFKTDNKDLYEFTLENIVDSDFKVISSTTNYLADDPFDKVTEYEASFREEGLPIYRIILGKK